MLYNTDHNIDELSILEYINSFTEAIGLQNVAINTVKLRQVCYQMHHKFPCVDGIAKASIFKKAAVFVASFVEHNPIDLEGFKNSKLMDNVKTKNPNAIVALNIAFKFMSLARVTRSDDKVLIISNGITLSMHSYCDFLDMLSEDIKLNTHFMPLALLFEQIVYKTHINMQYEPINFADETPEDIEDAERYIYKDQTNVPDEWDNPIDFWMNK